jgi:hypothetical protein
MREVLRFVALVAVLAVAGGLAAPGALGGTDLRPGIPTPPSALLWGSGIFFDRPAFEHWLRERNRTYEVWAGFHPAGRAILESAVQPVHFRPTPVVQPTPELAFVPAAKTGSRAASALLFVLGAIGLMLLALSVLPLRRLAPASSVAVALGERRLGVSAGGIAIIVGFVVAKLTS